MPAPSGFCLYGNGFRIADTGSAPSAGRTRTLPGSRPAEITTAISVDHAEIPGGSHPPIAREFLTVSRDIGGIHDTGTPSTRLPQNSGGPHPHG
ncbi:hypothetical protein [Streptomyces sp. NPDC001787]|uniref:hypothetical protein n=1 Tax=Streptomyces sp. NPDC001787 TaxID=3154523 RepID=UPI00332BCA93